MTRRAAERRFLRDLADVMQYAAARGIDISVNHTYAGNRLSHPVDWQLFQLSRRRGGDHMVRFLANCTVASVSQRVNSGGGGVPL